MYKKGIRGTLRCIDLLSLTISIALIVSLFGGECQAAQTDKFRTEPMFPGQEGYELVNFSDAPTGKFAELLQQTDLWKHNSQANPILNQNMRFFANKQFFGVINDQTAPGTLVGLYRVDSEGDFVGVREIFNGKNVAKSLVIINPGYGVVSGSADPARGYRGGVHTELWKRPEGPEGTFMTYPKGPPAVQNQDGSTETKKIFRFVSLLVNSNNEPIATDHEERQGRMTWTIWYTITADTFDIDVEVAADRDMNFTGEQGGLLLIMNTAGFWPGVYGDMGDLTKLGDRSFCNYQTDTHPPFNWLQDPSVSIGPETDAFYVESYGSKKIGDTWQLFANDALHQIVLTPRAWSSDAEDVEFRTAVHYNSRPSVLGGLNGFTSWDVVLRPKNGSIAIGNGVGEQYEGDVSERGIWRFGATLE